MAKANKVQFVPMWPPQSSVANLPNVSGAPTQDADLEVGDLCAVSGILYCCTTATVGAAVWGLASGGSRGTGQIDFGATNAQETTLVITGQAGILAGSTVSAWIVPTATTDHSVDEHLVDPPRVFAGTIVPGTGFTIYANAYNNPGSESYGKWSVAWMWS